MLFLKKTGETIWKPPNSKRAPSQKPPISEQIIHDPLFAQISKMRNSAN